MENKEPSDAQLGVALALISLITGGFIITPILVGLFHIPSSTTDDAKFILWLGFIVCIGMSLILINIIEDIKYKSCVSLFTTITVLTIFDILGMAVLQSITY